MIYFKEMKAKEIATKNSSITCTLIGLSLFLLLISCKKDENEFSVETPNDLPQVHLEWVRFDKLFYETPVESFPELRREYSIFFPDAFPDTLHTNKMTHPLYRELYTEVQSKFGDLSGLTTDVELLLSMIKYYFPNRAIPQNVATLISEMDYENKVIYTPEWLIISLDLYLGEGHRYYENEFPEYFKRTFNADQILPDIITAFAESIVPSPTDRTLLSQMIYFGKEMYLKDLLLPETKDHLKIAYTPEQLAWCKENAPEMWQYFIEQKILFSSDSKDLGRFISPAPFSKFYLDIDQESPGRVGVWLGWQIVRSYMKNNAVGLTEMLNTDAKTIFDNSKYKPKK
jgi:gliding motility-associated lipoprotein GldB